MFFKTNIAVILFCLVSYTNIYSQGCSDAGFCSIGGINPSSHLDSIKTLNHQVLFGLTSGMAQFGVLINSPYIQYDTKLTKEISVSAKINYSLINGSLTANHGFSDFYLTSKINLSQKISFVNGVKMPFNDADKTYKGHSLPMSYQSTLGTHDYLAGINYSSSNLLISLGTQIPIIQNNNSFFVEDFINEDINPNYISTNKFIRKPDLILRFNYIFKLKNESLRLTVGTMPIYHLKNDEYKDNDGIKRSINGSEGLTLNINSVLRYKMTKTSFFDVTMGIPVMSRKSRPDGLSQFALNIQYGIKF